MKSIVFTVVHLFLACTTATAITGRRETKSDVESAALQADITSDNLMVNLVAFSDIAIASGGNRAFGLPGYEASVDYVWQRISALEGISGSKQDFEQVYASGVHVNLTLGEWAVPCSNLENSPDTDGITASLVLGPAGDLACSPTSYEGIDVAGKVVLVERGTCPQGDYVTLNGDRVKAAKAAGAAAVVIYNNVASNFTGGTLGYEDPSNFITTIFIHRLDGLALISKLDTEPGVQVTIRQAAFSDIRTTTNVFAETDSGDADHVIMLGAHLDSVVYGAGINDDASGCSLLLELCAAISKYNTKYKIRFAWWAAEERGLWGSRHYVDNLPAEDASKIVAYLNFDMVSRGYFGVFDGDGSAYGTRAPEGSEVIQHLYTDDLTSKGVPVTAARWTNGSDYASFWRVLGTPIGGLHTGTGVAQDPCYHLSCDDISNPNIDTFTINAKSTAHVLSVLAMEGVDLISKRSAPVFPEKGFRLERDVRILTLNETEDERHLVTCGHDAAHIL